VVGSAGAAGVAASVDVAPVSGVVDSGGQAGGGGGSVGVVGSGAGAVGVGALTTGSPC